jgi:hypothetical protein
MSEQGKDCQGVGDCPRWRVGERIRERSERAYEHLS